MTRWTRIGLVMAAAVVLGSATTRAQQEAQPAPDSGQLKVTVEYKGQGAVDVDHRVWIWLFDTPNITAESIPIGTGVLKENNGSYKFIGMPKEVYIAVAYDEKGGYDGSSALPPTGTPVAIHGATGPGSPASAVPTGNGDATVKVVFDDTVRMP